MNSHRIRACFLSLLILALLSVGGPASGQGLAPGASGEVQEGFVKQTPGAVKARKPQVCYPGLNSEQVPAELFAVCVPDGFQYHQRGTEHVWSDGKGLDLVVAIQVKMTSADDALALIVPFLEKSGARIERLPDSRLRYFGETSRGMAFGRHQHRFGALVYSVCTKEHPDCAMAEETARSFSNSLEFLEPVVVPYEEWKTEKGEHVTVRVHPEGAAAKDKEWLSREYDKGEKAIRSALGLGVDQNPIQCFFYPDKGLLKTYTKRDSGFAIAEKGEIHSWFGSRSDRQSTGHEMTHVITFRAWGEPTEALIGEGIAVALDQSGRDLHKEAAAMLANQGGEFSLASMLGEGWFKAPPEVAYAISGSFVKFLLGRAGPEMLAELYKAKDFGVALQSVYGLSLEEAQKEWLATIGR